MALVELPPKIEAADIMLFILQKEEIPDRVQERIKQANSQYDYWDKVKHYPLPPEWTPQKFWTLLKANRRPQVVLSWGTIKLKLHLTVEMQRWCHEFDMNFGGNWANEALNNGAQKQHYLISSMMEEAISSSQMEGASTTRVKAKEMLQKAMRPRDKSQQMIANNYETIRFIAENRHTNLTPELLLHIHELMTHKTLDNNSEAGQFRNSDDIVVGDGITGEVAHTPPPSSEIPKFIDNLCEFFNAKDSTTFIHPIIRGIVMHFMIGYIHPFTDGNGRTARALFYWYMLRRGYWLTEYLSISRVIAKSKRQYEKAYLYTEADEMDLGYFVSYHLRVLQQAFEQLKIYLQRKQIERAATHIFLRKGTLNARQAQILKDFEDAPTQMITASEVQNSFAITHQTAKADINGLVKQGWLEEIALNKVKRGYVKSKDFDRLLDDLRS